MRHSHFVKFGAYEFEHAPYLTRYFLSFYRMIKNIHPSQNCNTFTNQFLHVNT